MSAPITPPETASEAVARFDAGTLTPADYLQSCLQAVDDHEPALQAFATLARDDAVASAAKAAIDGAPLAGIPIGVKDVIDTAGLATEFNSPLYAGRVPETNAACISILEACGAYVLGKTTTVEFASLGQVPPTRNPHDPEHTPGGTSAGSAVAVATGMVPVALGTQTGGSTIRPASFCGVAALKPTYGLVPLQGLKLYAPSLDTISWMARSVADLERVLRCFQPAEDVAVSADSLTIGFYPTPYWDQALPATRDALHKATELLRAAGVRVEALAVDEQELDLNRAQDTIMHAEGRRSYLAEYLQWPTQLHPALRDEVENARGITGQQLVWAYDYLARMRMHIESRMQGFDAWLVPAVPGEAPAGLESTGDAVFNRLWTGLHMPAVTVPGFSGEQGLPVGVQLVSRRYDDQRLLGAAGVLEALINTA